MVPLHGVHRLQKVLFQKGHDGGDLRLGPLPVLRGEGVDRQVLHADVLAVGGDAAEGLRPCLVAGGAGKALPCGPAAVAVHDDGDMPGQTGEVRLWPRRFGLFRKEGHRGRSFVSFYGEKPSAGVSPPTGGEIKSNPFLGRLCRFKNTPRPASTPARRMQPGRSSLHQAALPLDGTTPP